VLREITRACKDKGKMIHRQGLLLADIVNMLQKLHAPESGHLYAWAL